MVARHRTTIATAAVTALAVIAVLLGTTTAARATRKTTVEDLLAEDTMPRCASRPQQLVRAKENEAQISLERKALEFLRDPVRAHRAVVPITVVGTARSGKSFFLGMATGCREYFPVGHSTLSKTEGAEMYAMESPWHHEGQEEGPLYLLIDTQGLDYGSSHDTAILLFAVMASSRVVYHLDQKIRHHDVRQLAELALWVSKTYREMKELEVFPPLTWVVDRYSLEDMAEAKELGHVNVTTREGAERYLYEYRLREKSNPDNNPRWCEYNETVRMAKTWCRSREAFFIVSAIQNNSKSVQLDALPRTEMDPRYLAQMAEVRDVLLSTPPKRLSRGDKPLTCADLAQHLEHVLPFINKGLTEVGLGEAIRQALYKRAAAGAAAEYNRTLRRLGALPLEPDRLDAERAPATHNALAVFERSLRAVVGSNSYYEGEEKERLLRSLEELQQQWVKNNEIAIEALVLETQKNAMKSCDELKIVDERLYMDKVHEFVERAIDAVRPFISSDRVSMLAKSIRSTAKVSHVDKMKLFRQLLFGALLLPPSFFLLLRFTAKTNYHFGLTAAALSLPAWMELFCMLEIPLVSNFFLLFTRNIENRLFELYLHVEHVKNLALYVLASLAATVTLVVLVVTTRCCLSIYHPSRYNRRHTAPSTTNASYFASPRRNRKARK